jgi:hypothetical protein
MDISNALKETAQISAMTATVSHGTIFVVKIDTNNQVTVSAKDIHGQQRQRSSDYESILALYLKDSAEACLAGQLLGDDDRMFVVTIDTQGSVTVAESN